MSLSEFRFSAGKCIGNKLFFSNYGFNGLFQLDMQTMEVEFIDFFPDENICQGMLHSRCFYYKEMIGFLPWMGKHIHLYNINTGEILAIKLHDNYGLVYIDTCLHGSDLWVIPGDMEYPLLRLNLETLVLEEIEGFPKWCEEHLRLNDSVNPAFWNAAYMNGKIYLGVRGTGEIVELDIEKHFWRKYITDIPSIAHVHKSESGLWGISEIDSDGVYKWEPEINKSKRYACCVNTKKEHCLSNEIVEFGTEVYIIPDGADAVLKLDKKKECFQERLEYNDKELSIKDSVLGCLECEMVGDKLLLFPSNCNALLVIDNAKTKLEYRFIKSAKIDPSREPYKSYFRERRAQRIISEDEHITLSLFLQYLDVFQINGTDEHEIQNFGSHIYQALK